MAAAILGFLAVWLVILWAPDTPVAGALRRWLIERPAARLAHITRGHLALVLLLVIAASGIVWLMEGDGVRVLSMAAPELAVWLTTFEIATYLDVAIGIGVAASSIRFGHLRMRLGKLRPRARRSRATPRPERRAANDDEDRPALPLAA